MKKIIIAASLMISTVVLPSYTKQLSVKPSAISSVDPSLALAKKDIGTAD